MTTRRIGGLVDYSKLMPAQPDARSAESVPPAAALAHDEQARHDFALLPHDQQRQAINRLAAAGHTDDVISRATGLSTDYVRRLLSEPGARP